MNKKWVLACAAASFLMSTAVHAEQKDETPAAVEQPQSPWSDPRPDRDGFHGLNGVKENGKLDIALNESGSIAFSKEPVIENGSTLVPYDTFLGKLGYTSKWNEAENTVTATKAGVTIVFAIGRDTAEINGAEAELPVAAKLIDGTPFIPLRFTAETDLREVVWQDWSRKIQIKESKSLSRIRILLQANGDAASKALAGLTTRIEAETGLQIEFIEVPQASYQDKLNLMIAAGDVPDLMFVPEQAAYPVSLIPAIFKNIGEAVRDYPNLLQASNSIQGVMRANGGLYGIPQQISRFDAKFPALRADWLRILQLNKPAKMDELMDVLVKFKRTDPDGNGRDDTVGLVGNTAPDSLGGLAWVENVFNESAGRYKLKDGAVVDTIGLSSEREALLWLSRAARDGVLFANFMAGDSGKSYRVEDGKAGAAAMTVDEAASLTEQLRTETPKADLLPLVSLKAGGKAVVPIGSGQAGTLALGTQIGDSKLAIILSLLDKLAAVEPDGAQTGATKSFPGIEIEKLSAETAKQLNAFLKLSNHEAKPQVKPAGDAVTDRKTQILQEREAVGFEAQNPIDGRLLENMEKAKLRELDAAITDMKVKLIMGKISAGQWDDYVKQVQTDENYKKLMNRLNEGYKAAAAWKAD